MIRNIMIAATMLGVVGLALPEAEARPRPRKGAKFEANKTFGIGLQLGAPTAFVGKYYLSSSTALDFGIGSYYQYRDREGLHLHVDHLWHPVNLIKTKDFWVPLYVGIGARYLDHGDHAHVGPRVPLGVALDFTNVPLDIFLELAFVLDALVDHPNDDRLDSDLGGAIGIRYYFN